jgi:hypothetical protein
VSEGKVARQSVPITFYANDPQVRFSAQAGTTLTANYKSAAPVQQQAQSRQDPSSATGLTSLQPYAPN